MLCSTFTRICWKICLVVVALIGSSTLASAVVDFENPPYTIGGIEGQDGWALPSYASAANGTLEVSTTNPLAGAQSLSYTRTEAGLGATFRDVYKPDVVQIAKDGTPTPDLNATFLISSTSLAAEGMGYGVNGLFLGPDGANGVTPLGVRLTNAGSTIPSIEEFAAFGSGGAFYYFGGSLASAAFPENDTLEFSIDVDFDSATYTVEYRNVTTGGPTIASGITRGFAVAYPTNSHGAYDIDVTAAFRYGAGKIDNISLTGNIVPEPMTWALSLTCAAAMCLWRR